MATGWATRLLGIWPICRTELGMETGYYHRYCRKGLLDFLPSNASDYEKSLAVCADHVVLEWEQNCYLKTFDLPDPWKNMSDKLDALKVTLERIIHRRCIMTETEATEQHFRAKIAKTISDFLKLVPPLSTLMRTCGDKSSHFMFMLKIEDALRAVLAPWADITLSQCATDRHLPPTFQLCDAFSGEIWLGVDPNPTASASSWAQWDLACRIFDQVEVVRDMILNGDTLANEYLEFAFCFRTYLESSDESQLPDVTQGTSRTRQQTPHEIRRATIQFPGCVCNQQNSSDTPSIICGCPWYSRETQFATHNCLRRSQDVRYVREREAVQTFFKKEAEKANQRDLAEWRGPARTVRQGIFHLLPPYIRPEFAHLVKEM
jgi:hypothetical protein